MVKVNVPVGLFLIVVTVRVELEELGDVTVTGFGLKMPVLPVGKPLTLRFTVPLYPFNGVSVTVYCVLLPCSTVCEGGVADMAKSGVGGPPHPLNLNDPMRVLQ